MKKILVITLLSMFLIGCENETLKSEEVYDSELEQQAEKRDYYGYQEFEYSWVYDVSDYTKVIDNATKILKVKVLDTGDGTFEFSSGVSASPLSLVEVEVLEVLYGNNSDMDITTIYKEGGDVTIEQMIDYYPSEKIEKMGLDDISIEEAKNKYMAFETIDLEKDGIYILTLKQWNDENIWFITPSGYGVFKLNDINTLETNSNETYTNFITNKTVDIAEFRK